MPNSLALVVTADDLGIDPRRDEGILHAFRQGVVRQSSLLVNGRSAVDAARAVRDAGLAVGLHLNLTEGPTAAPAERVRSLLGDDGVMRGKHGFRRALAQGEVNLDEVVLESLAQLARFAELTGHPATHFDGHQHAHTLAPIAAAIAGPLAREGVRSTRIAAQPSVVVADPTAAAFYAQVSEDGKVARALYAGAGIRSTACFVGLDLMGDAASAEGLLRALEAVPQGASVEYMCHPGYVGTGVDSFNESTAREHELRLLVSPELRAMLEARGATLASFDALAAQGGLA